MAGKQVAMRLASYRPISAGSRQTITHAARARSMPTRSSSTPRSSSAVRDPITNTEVLTFASRGGRSQSRSRDYVRLLRLTPSRRRFHRLKHDQLGPENSWHAAPAPRVGHDVPVGLERLLAIVEG